MDQTFTMINPPMVFEYLVHLLELSVVVGIAATIYVTKKHPRKASNTAHQKSNQEFSLHNICPDDVVIFKEDKKSRES